MKVLIIDNYDSFTFNLYQYVGEILKNTEEPSEVIVKRNDELSLSDIKAMCPDRIIISPGPGTPEDPKYFGICRDVILEMGPTVPVLGVCLGMQGIVSCFGGRVIHATLPMHGKVSVIRHEGTGVFQGMPQELEVMRYHSLMADPESFPSCLAVTSVVDSEYDEEEFLAAAKNGSEIMGVRHREYPISGIQFHPESFATEGGRTLLENFLYQY